MSRARLIFLRGGKNILCWGRKVALRWSFIKSSTLVNLTSIKVCQWKSGQKPNCIFVVDLGSLNHGEMADPLTKSRKQLGVNYI